MNWFPGPSASEERAQALLLRTPAVKVEGPWRHNGVLLRLVFSLMALIAVAALFGFFTLIHLPKGWLTAALAIGAAELLIREHRFFRTGLESALWLGGTFAFICGLPSSGKVEAILVFAAAAALSGWRMRNAFFGVLAAVLVIAYVAAKWDHAPALTLIVASLIALVGALARCRVWQRPSNDQLFGGLVLALPAAGYLATVVQRIFRTSASPDFPVAAILAVTALLLFALGVLWRDRLVLLSTALTTAMAGIELRELFNYPTEAKLIVAGTVLIAIAAILGRALRNATQGFVVTPVRVGAYEEAMQIGGIIAVAPHGTAATHEHTGPDLTDSAGPTDKSYGGGGAGGGF